ncbi:phage terminase, small subunit, putative, P27 family [Rhodovulum sp. ES.010]|uniref:P27 family phage terminase small subunit n=1 Tax=Rhodovulum sp. ES.010 TaxID=1882821 RepID=UPI00092882B5|nr:P27 family phage terminase small subunit [Rhodovulum sp. ES.010]SIO36645.1 phage terminase, small subunit, putative, P27 family [Rhodovulum sp. ES.010]
MRGAKPRLDNVVPMKGDVRRPVPDAPDFLSDEGRKAWDRLAPILIAKDRLEPQFEDLFAAYCEAVAAFVEATGDLAAFGKYFETKTRNGKQEKKRAAWGQRQEAIATMARLSALFGFSPVDEKRMASNGQFDLLAELEKSLNGSA